jgi:hypothetical protein
MWPRMPEETVSAPERDRQHCGSTQPAIAGNFVHHIQRYKDTINLYEVKAHAGIRGNKCTDAISKCSAGN